MPTVDEYLDRAKAQLNTASDRHLSKHLGFVGPAVSQWRTKRAWPSDEAMLKLAELAGVTPEQALADLNTWRAKSDQVQAVYAAIAKKIGAAAAAFIVFVLANIVDPAHANSMATKAHQIFPNYTLCDIWR